MDRVATGLSAALVVLAGWTLLGAQGARLGPLVLAALSPWWLVTGAIAVLLLSRRRPATQTRATLFCGVGLAASFALLGLWRSATLSPALEVEVVANGQGFTARSLQLAERRELRRLVGRRRNLSFEASATLEVPRSGRYRFDVYCDDACEIVVGDRTFEASGRLVWDLELVRGDVPFRIQYRQEGGPATLLFSWRTPRLFELLPMEYFLRAPEEPARRRASAHAALIGMLAWWCCFAIYLVHLGGRWNAIVRSRALPMAAAVALVAYGSILRLEALLAHTGLLSGSSTSAALHETILPITPPYAIFNPDNAPDDPYRADVRSYLDRSESLTLGGFYEASFREPFYVLLTKPFLWLCGGEIGILVQSLFFSCLTLVLFYLMAKSLHGRHWALLLLAPVVLHEWLILEAPTGYRMSAYGFFLLLFWWALDGPMGTARALGGGFLAGLTSLIRLSALSAIAPLIAVKLWPGCGRRIFWGGTLGAVMLLLVVPFLWSNYRTHGDPLYSISFHTEFWLRAEGLDDGQGPVSLNRYVTDFGRAGRIVRGTLAGMTWLPLETFWNGLRRFPILDGALLLSGVIGLLAAVTSSKRTLLVAYLGHLLPFAYIQSFPSGEMPRFVMPAYFFLVLAAPLGVKTVSRLWKRVVSTSGVLK